MMLARCPKCNREVEVNTSVVLTSIPPMIPPMYNLDCPNCGRQYVLCKDCYSNMGTNKQTNSERYLFKKIDELEKHQNEQDKKIKQLEEKIKLASIGFPINFFE